MPDVSSDVHGPDVSTAEAVRRLSVAAPATDAPGADEGPLSLSRRRFLQAVAAGAAGALASGVPLPGFLGWDEHRAEAAPVGPDEGILVLVGMFGGNDGLRMVAPVGSRHYERLRPSVRLTAPDLLPLSSRYALAPELVGVKQMWDAGQVAIVHGTGYERPNLSHFTSMAYWMSARPNGVPSSGWIGRWLDGAPADVFRAATLSNSVPLHMIGAQNRGIAVPPWGPPDLGVRTGKAHQRAYAAFRSFADLPADASPWKRALATTLRDTMDVNARVGVAFPKSSPSPLTDEIGRKMVAAARLINADLGFRVLDMGWGDFDHHANETTSHPQRMRELDAALSTFFALLDPRFAGRVLVMTYSEFGRTPFDNASRGTDHGTSHPMLLIGPAVNGGFHGTHPRLKIIRSEWDRLEVTTDFRSVYATVLDGWLGGGSSDVLGGTIPTLPLLRSGPTA